MFSADPDQTVVFCVIPDERQSKELPGGPPRHCMKDILSNNIQLREGPRSMPDDKIGKKELACLRGPSKGRDGIGWGRNSACLYSFLSQSKRWLSHNLLFYLGCFMKASRCFCICCCFLSSSADLQLSGKALHPIGHQPLTTGWLWTFGFSH